MAEKITLPPGPVCIGVKRVIAAGGKEPVDVPGAFVRIIEADQLFELGIDSAPTFPFSLGMEYRCERGEFFRRVMLHNTSAAVLTVSLLIGVGEVRDDRLNIVRERPASIQPVVEAELDCVGWDGTEIASAGDAVFPGTVTGRQIRRRAIQVFNADATNSLELYDAAGERIAIVFKESGVTIPASGYVRVHNPAASPIQCAISEVFWLRPA